MPDQPKKLDAKSRKILEALERCIKEHGDDGYAPLGFERRPDASDRDPPAASFRFQKIRCLPMMNFGA